LVIYVLILLSCGAVAAHEFVYLLGADTTSGKILGVGKTSASLRHARYWADYEYFDADQVRHVGRAENVPPVTRAGQSIEIEYLRHAPATSRLAAPPAGALCYGVVAVLAASAFAGEILVGRRRRWARSPEVRGDPESA
jgi:hypothetical protein